MNNENYSPMSKLKTIPLSPFPSVLPKPFLAPVPFDLAEGLPPPFISLYASVQPKPFSLPHFSSRTFFSYCCTKIHIEARNSL